jgi:hypothetical protein
VPQPLIIQVPKGTPVDRQLFAQPPRGVADDGVVVERMAPDAEGNLDPPPSGEIVLSVPSPETLAREPDEVRRVIREAGTGSEPLVVVVEDAELLRDEELAPLIDAVDHAPRPVILRIIRSR